MASAQDHKRVGDGDTGPNTGGMGAYSPAPIVTEAMTTVIMETIINPTLEGMKAEGRPYKGVLYAGLMIENHKPKLLEYNVRFGDPECQVLMMRVMAANGYPGSYEKGSIIRGLDTLSTETEVSVFHAGTALNERKEVSAVGGRVLAITALGEGIIDAQTKAYKVVDSIDWPGGFCRRDIGWRAIEREN